MSPQEEFRNKKSSAEAGTWDEGSEVKGGKAGQRPWPLKQQGLFVLSKEEAGWEAPSLNNGNKLQEHGRGQRQLRTHCNPVSGDPVTSEHLISNSKSF